MVNDDDKDAGAWVYYKLTFEPSGLVITAVHRIFLWFDCHLFKEQYEY